MMVLSLDVLYLLSQRERGLEHVRIPFMTELRPQRYGSFQLGSHFGGWAQGVEHEAIDTSRVMSLEQRLIRQDGLRLGMSFS